MSEKEVRKFDLRTATPEEMRLRMNLGVADALRDHKEAGNSIVVWDREHDRVVLVPPEQIVVPTENAEVEAATTRRER